MSARQFWSEEAIAALRELWPTGLSCKAIALRLGVMGLGTYSRNAVIGKVHRLDLPDRPRQVERARPTPRPKAAIVMAPEPVSIPMRLLDAGMSQCRWPMWDQDGNPDFLVCGARTVPGETWCVAHKRKGLTPAKPRRSGTREGEAEAA